MDIVQAIRKNKEEGAKRLEKEYKLRLMDVACRLCDDSTEAEHLVFMTFGEAVRRIESISKPESFFSWLCSILVGIRAKSVRRKEHETVIYTDSPPDEGIDGASKVFAAVDAGILREAITHLPADMKEAVVLHYFMEIPLGKIAKILTLPIGTVKSRLYYARVLLAQRLGASLRKPAVVMLVALVTVAVSAATWFGVTSFVRPDAPCEDDGPLDAETVEPEEMEYSPVESTESLRMNERLRESAADDTSDTSAMDNRDISQVQNKTHDFDNDDNKGETTMNATDITATVGRLAVAAAMFAQVASADVTTNTWQGTSGGRWGDTANWSLNRLPSTTDYVVFPDTGSSYSINIDGNYECGTFYVDYRLAGQTSVVTLTLTGDGSVTASWAAGSLNQHVVRGYRKLVLDGISLALNGNNLLLYTGLELKNGACYTSDNPIYLWSAGATVSLGSTCSFENTGVIVNGENVAININGGVFQSGNISMYQGTEHAINVSLAGGSATFRSLPLYKTSTLSISEGSVFVTTAGGFILVDSAVLNLVGGSIQIRDALTSTRARLVRESHGTAVETLVSIGGNASSLYNCGVDALRTNETVVLSAPVTATGGAFALREGSVIESEYPLTVKQFFNEPGIVNAATLRIKTIVFGGAIPFSNTGSESGAKRYVNIEGPTTIRAFSDMVKPGHGFYPMVSGRVTVDTRDWNDPDVQRRIYLGLGTCTAADLVFTGGGEVGFYQPRPFRGAFSSIVVSNNTTLTLSDQGRSYVRAEEFTLGPGSVLNIPAGTNTVYAGRWNIDPTATINVIVPSWMGPRACAALVDTEGDSLAAHADMINITGSATGWSVSHQNGTLAVVKAAGSVDGTYPYEWTGGTGNANFSEAGNWYCETAPQQYLTHAFGAVDTVLSPFFDNVWSGESKGYSVGTILFRETAVKTFTISSAANITMTCSNSSQTPAVNTITHWGVYSESDVPQRISVGTLRHGNRLTLATVGAAPVTIDSNLIGGQYDTQMAGNIRFTKSGNINVNKVLLRQTGGDASLGTTISVMSGTTLEVNSQNAAITTGDGVSLYVAEGGTLRFKAADNAMYKWTCAQPGKNMVDGSLDILAPYVNADNVVYGGNGRIDVSEFRCSSAAGSLGLAGSVNLYPPSAWNTVDSYGANTPFVLKAYETPTIHLSENWRYGPDSDVAGTTTSTASNRACVIASGAKLTIAANGHSATFADPVFGRGTLSVTNGTLRLDGGNAATLGIEVCQDGVFQWTAATSVRTLMLTPGASLAFPIGQPLAVAGDVELPDVILTTDREQFRRTHGWQTVLSSTGTISGTAGIGNAMVRVVAANGGQELQVRFIRGIVIDFK